MTEGQLVAPIFVGKLKEPFSSKMGTQKARVFSVFLAMSTYPIVGVFNAQIVTRAQARLKESQDLYVNQISELQVVADQKRAAEMAGDMHEVRRLATLYNDVITNQKGARHEAAVMQQAAENKVIDEQKAIDAQQYRHDMAKTDLTNPTE